MGKVVDGIRKPTKFVIGSMASIGAGALLGHVMKNYDISNMRGLGRICVGVGISGLALAGGEVAKNAMDRKIDNSFKLLGVVEDIMDGANNISEALENFKNKMDAEMAEEMVVDDPEDSDEKNVDDLYE